METGKIEFAPDYKSANKAAIELLDEWLAHPVVEETPEAAKFRKRISGAVEQERLKDAVIEAADSWEQRIDDQYVTIYERHDHYKKLRAAIVALRDFERGMKENS